MKPTFRLGRLAGVDVGTNWTWLIVVMLIGWSLAGAVFPETTPGLAPEAYVLMALVTVPVFFASLLLHELGHEIRARRRGAEQAGARAHGGPPRPGGRIAA